MTIGKLNVSKVYINDKIPYAYDYADVDTNVSGGESHGTHVAGIVGATVAVWSRVSHLMHSCLL